MKPVSEKDILSATSALVRRGHIRRVAGVFGPIDPAPNSVSWRLAQEVQAGLPVVAEPYREVARRLGLSEDELLDSLKSLRQTGGLRRIGAILGSPARQSQPSTV